MSIPDDIRTIELSSDNIMFGIIALAIIIGAYLIIFHAVPLGEARDAELEDIKNNMSCGDLKQMILETSAMSQVNRAEVKHQFEWRCEK